MSKTFFGKTPNGEDTFLYEISDGKLCAQILDFGASVYSLKLKDRNGVVRDMILAPEKLEDFVDGSCYFDVTCGRYANRISDAKFTLNGKEYHLVQNNGKNHLHGGLTGFSRTLWKAEEISEDTVRLSHFSPDGEDGYPGNLNVEITFSVVNSALKISYKAVAEDDTIINLTNHAFFNVSGHDCGSINDLLLQIDATQYIPTDDGGIPQKQFAPVKGTPYDFTEPKKVGKDIEADHEQLRFGNGYDQCFVIDGIPAGTVEGLDLRECAKLYSEETGIAMRVLTNMPGVQLYTANGIGGNVGKDGVIYQRRGGLCLEAANFPNAVNREDYPDAVLRKGETYRQVTIYDFKVE